MRQINVEISLSFVYLATMRGCSDAQQASSAASTESKAGQLTFNGLRIDSRHGGRAPCHSLERQREIGETKLQLASVASMPTASKAL